MSMFQYSTHNPHHKTPTEFYNELDKEFHFDCDPCPLAERPKQDGLSIDWGQSTYVNPPYTGVKPWIEKAIKECKKGKLVVMLLRGDTSTSWFHDLVVPNADEIRFVRGRLKFTGKPAPFPSIIAIFRPNKRGNRS